MAEPLDDEENPGDVIYDMLGDFLCELFVSPMWNTRVVGVRDWRTGLRRDQPAASRADAGRGEEQE